MFSIPCRAAPAISASSPSRFRSRHVSCSTGSIPSCWSAIATASGEACAWAEVLSVAFVASTYSANGSNRSRTASKPPESTVWSSDVTANRPPVSASSSRDMPPLRRLLVASRREVDPGGRTDEPVVDRRPHVVDLVRPRQPSGALDGLEPDAAHLRLHLAVPVRAHAAARAVAQRLRALHRTGEAG